MANPRLSKENLTEIRQQIQQRRKERKATASGNTDIGVTGTYVDVSYWDAFTLNGALWVIATVTSKSDSLSSCEVFLTPEAGGPRSADGFAIGDIGNSVMIGALTDLITTRPGMVHSELTGTTTRAFFQYQADLYVYDITLSASAKVAAGAR